MKVSLLRRLAAIFYDCLLCISIMIFITFIYQQCFLRIIYGEKCIVILEQNVILKNFLFLLLLSSIFLFFIIFWTYHGQTLGMQAWNIRVQNRDGSNINIIQSIIRLIMAFISFSFFGLGFFWIFFDKYNRTWHDCISKTQLILKIH